MKGAKNGPVLALSSYSVLDIRDEEMTQVNLIVRGTCRFGTRLAVLDSLQSNWFSPGRSLCPGIKNVMLIRLILA